MKVVLFIRFESLINLGVSTKYIVLSLLLISILLVSGCTTQNGPRQTDSSPSYFNGTNLSLIGTPSLNTTVTIVLTVRTSGYVEPNSSLWITLPDSFELISGNLSWMGHIPHSSTFQINVSAKSTQTGTWFIQGGGGPSFHPKFDGDGLYVTVNENTGHTSRIPPTCSGSIEEVMECMRSGVANA